MVYTELFLKIGRLNFIKLFNNLIKCKRLHSNAVYAIKYNVLVYERIYPLIGIGQPAHSTHDP